MESFSQRDVLHSGWITSRCSGRRPFRSWKPYWCVLADGQIFYFRLAGSLPVKGCKLLSRTSNDPDEPLGFVLQILPKKSKSTKDTTNSEEKHGKPFLLCSPKQTELDVWEREIRKVRGGIFGQSLEDTIVNESESTTKQVPNIVEHCIKYIRRHGLKEEGIFRLNGKSGAVQELQDEFDRGEIPCFDDRCLSVHTVASLLKRYFTLLPEPIIPWRHCRYFIPAMQRLHESEDEGQRQIIMQLALLPKVNYNLLKCICQFLFEVHKHEIHNKMGLGNLANIFAPHILRPQYAEGSFLLGSTALSLQLVHYLIKNQEKVFPPFSVLNSVLSISPDKNVKRYRRKSFIGVRSASLDLPSERNSRFQQKQKRVRSEDPFCPLESTYTNGEVIERHSGGSEESDRTSLYENVELNLPSCSNSTGSLIEALKVRISEVPGKQRAKIEQRAKRFGVSYRDPASVISTSINHRSFSNASTAVKASEANLSDDSKEGILMRGKKPKWLKGDSNKSTYQNLEMRLPNVGITKDHKNQKDKTSVPKEYRKEPMTLEKPAKTSSANQGRPLVKQKHGMVPVPAPRSIRVRLPVPEVDENCNEPYAVNVKMMPVMNGEVTGHIQGLRSRLRQKEEEVVRQQKLLEKMQNDLDKMRQRLSLEECARQKADQENAYLTQKVATLRQRLASQ